MSGQGKFLATRMSKNPYGVTDHIVERFMERWPDSRHLTKHDVRNHINDQIATAIKNGEEQENYDGKKKVPISFMGVDGWAIVGPDGDVVTVYPINQEK